MIDINEQTHYDDMDEMGQYAQDRYSKEAKIFWRVYLLLLAVAIASGYKWL